MLMYVVFAESVGCARPQTSSSRALGRGTRFRGFLHQDCGIPIEDVVSRSLLTRS